MIQRASKDKAKYETPGVAVESPEVDRDNLQNPMISHWQIKVQIGSVWLRLKFAASLVFNGSATYEVPAENMKGISL